MRCPLLLLVPAILITACSETPPLAPDRESDLAKGGGGPPATGNITVVDLGFTLANDIDEHGRVAGWSQSSAGTRAILWTPVARRGTTGTARTLPGLGGKETYAVGMNEAQQVVGLATDGSTYHAVLWNGDLLQVLGDGVASGSAADDLSDPSEGGIRFVVGRTEGPFRPAVWRVSGVGGISGPELLPGYPAGVSGGQAIAANSSGLIVGDSESPSTILPVRWTESATGWEAAPLALLPGTSRGQALDVNEDGAAVGFNSRSSGCSRGVAWTPPSYPAVPLQDLAGGFCSWAWAINGVGQITGGARDARGAEQPVLWTPLGTGGYSILPLGGSKRVSQGQGRSLNDPEADPSGGRTLEVVGITGGRATLWKVKLP